MTDAHTTEQEAASKQAKINAELSRGYLVQAHSEPDPHAANTKAIIGILICASSARFVGRA